MVREKDRRSKHGVIPAVVAISGACIIVPRFVVDSFVASQSMPVPAAAGVEVVGPVSTGHASILTPRALKFLVGLQREFNDRRRALLAARQERQRELDAGQLPEFRSETASVRTMDWRVAPLPRDLLNRRVEITGPVDRKMIINALNSGANCFMADFEDAHSPTWLGTLEGQINVRDAVNGTIEYVHPETKKHYRLNERVATLLVRPRGWHLEERHVSVDGQPMSASLFDFGLFFFHNARSADRERERALFLSAQTGKPSGGSAVERRVHQSPDTIWAYRTARFAPPC